MGNRRDSLILTGMMAMACIVALSALALERSYPLEAFGFVTGVICVWLAAKENVWNWPIGLLNSFASVFVMFRDRLFADAALYVIYFVSGVLGWYWWLRGGEKKDPPPIRATPRREWPIIAASGLGAMGLVAYWMFSIGGAAPLVDTFVTVMSLVAQYLLTRKYIENWIIWILVDVIYVPLFLWKGLYLYAILFAIFTVIAYFGLREWTRLRPKQEGEAVPMPARKLVGGMLVAGVGLTTWMIWICWRFETQLPPNVLTVMRGADALTASFSTSGSDRGKDLTPDQFVHVKANILDPLLFHPVEAPDSASAPVGWLRFWKKDEKTRLEVELLTYEVFGDYLKVEGRAQSLAAWRKMQPYLPAP